MHPYQICTHCIIDTSDPNIRIDERGHYDYCNNFDATIQPNYELQQLFDSPKKMYRDYKNKHELIDLGVNLMRKLGLEKRYFR